MIPAKCGYKKRGRINVKTLFTQSSIIIIPARLKPEEPGVIPAASEKLLVRAFLDDRAALQHDDLIGVHDA